MSNSLPREKLASLTMFFALSVFTTLCLASDPTLEAYYPFNGNANDGSGNGRHGNVNGATITLDRVGAANSAYSFDGNDFIQIPEAAGFEQNSLTASVWVNATTFAYTGGIGPYIDLIGKDGGFRQWIIQIKESGQVRGAVFTASGEHICDSVSVLSTNAWHHIVLVWNGATSSVYINGTLDNSVVADGALASGNEPVRIGGSPQSGQYLHGKADDARIYSRALSAAEVQQLYALEVGNIQLWRQAYFGSTANSGNGADLNDYEGDGLVNLIEFAFGLNPKTNSAGQLPQGTIIGGNYVISFNQPTVSGITYGAEWSTTLQPGSWTPIPDTGIPPQHVFSVPIGPNTRMFTRLKVTSP